MNFESASSFSHSAILDWFRDLHQDFDNTWFVSPLSQKLNLANIKKILTIKGIVWSMFSSSHLFYKYMIYNLYLSSDFNGSKSPKTLHCLERTHTISSITKPKAHSNVKSEITLCTDLFEINWMHRVDRKISKILKTYKL